MKRPILQYLPLIALMFLGCGNTTESSLAINEEIKTPVTISSIEQLDMSETVRLSATSSYLKKNQVKANTTGYIEKSLVSLGAYVKAGTPLFYIRTKEAEALGKFRQSDSTLNIKGLIVIKAPESGVLTEVNKFANDYTTDGDVLAVIAQQSSLVFLLNVPFELRQFAAIGTSCTVLLTDSTQLIGRISKQLPTIDPVSQTMPCEVNISSKQPLPENLIATVLLVVNQKKSAQVVDKPCVLSDETMEHFWVMKLLNDTTAIKVPVVKGITSDTKIEIISPVFSKTDRLLYSGHYGLPDTAFVVINK